MTSDVRAAKDALRTSVLATRTAMSAEARAAAGVAIAHHGLRRLGHTTAVAAYLEVGSEPPTARLLDTLLERSVHVVLPVIDADGLDWSTYTGPVDLAAGPLGIHEPAGPRLGVGILRLVDVVIVPALAVDQHGNRLGRGRGYYDRALADVTATLVAVGYDDELLDHVPTEPHDHPVDEVLRPAGLRQLVRPTTGQSRPRA